MLVATGKLSGEPLARALAVSECANYLNAAFEANDRASNELANLSEAQADRARETLAAVAAKTVAAEKRKANSIKLHKTAPKK